VPASAAISSPQPAEEDGEDRVVAVREVTGN